MVKPNYNPFRPTDIIETQHGIITYENKRYFTHRKREHIFKKHQAFGISTTELETCYQQNVNHIIIKYHGNKKNIIYKIELHKTLNMQRHNQNGDTQILIPLNELKIVGEEIITPQNEVDKIIKQTQ